MSNGLDISHPAPVGSILSASRVTSNISGNVDDKGRTINEKLQTTTLRFLQSAQSSNSNLDSNIKDSYDRIGNAKANSSEPILTTEAIIEELKSLSKSMLDATNAARLRASTLENRSSYEALMNAIANRNKTATTNSKNPFSNISISDSNTLKQHSANAPIDVRSSFPLSLSPRFDKLATFGPTLRDMDHLEPSYKQNPTPSYVDPVPNGKGNLWSAEGEHITDIPASLSRLYSKKKQTETDETYIDREEVTSDSHADALPSARENGSSEASIHMSKPITHMVMNDVSDAEETHDDICNGVKTQCFFKSTDPDAYRDIKISAWKPEILLRAEDGSVYPHTQSNQRNHANHPCHQHEDDESDYEGTACDNESRSEISEENGNGSQDAGSHFTDALGKPIGKLQTVFRVPSFPYGGGITYEQAREMAELFQKCILYSKKHYRSSNNEENRKAENVPILISKKDFDAHNYKEVPCYVDMPIFEPTSLFQFVVEVERSVIFDARRARKERRKKFRCLAEQGLAPVTMSTFNLRVIMDPTKTGFEDKRNFPIVKGSIIADRYKIIGLLGKATFSRAVRCYDLCQPIYEEEEAENDETSSAPIAADGDATSDGIIKGSANGNGSPALKNSVSQKKVKRKLVGYAEVCLKIINNRKDFFDQSLDEIRLLTLLNTQSDPDKVHIVRLLDAFYYKEHTMIVTELLRENLYEYSKYNHEMEEEFYFTLPRIQCIARQVVEALAYVHGLNLIHADLKPENILFLSYRRCLVKVIDFGSSSFLSDHLSSYIQSRSYRAPEVILGCDYDGRIDVWSLGAILFELVTGEVLFSSESSAEMLARIVYVCGMPLPRQMLWEGRHTCDFINKFGCIYELSNTKVHGNGDAYDVSVMDSREEEHYYIYTPVITYPSKSSKPVTRADSRLNQSPDLVATKSLNDSDGNANKGGSIGTNNVSGGESGDALSPSRVIGPYSVLRQKLANFGMTDQSFLSFLEACLTLDHKKRPTSAQLLSHEFIANITV